MKPLRSLNPLRIGRETDSSAAPSRQISISDMKVAGGAEMTHDALAMIEYRDDPPVLIFGDSDGALARGQRTAELAGCRVAAAESVGGAITRLEQPAARYPILLEVDAPEAREELVLLLERLESEAQEGRSSVVVAPPALIDLVAASVFHPDVRHLCAPSEAERVAELALATRRPAPQLHDIGREGHAVLQQLSEEVGRIANILAALSEEEAAELAAKPLNGREADEPPVDAAYVRALIRARRLRDQYFRGGLFADPAWDMLLDLMAARLEKNRVAVSSLCIAAAVPATTALRWIRTLTERGLFVRSADPQDGRRVYIELSDETARALGAYLHHVQRIAPTVV
jgi:hypothetical protein